MHLDDGVGVDDLDGRVRGNGALTHDLADVVLAAREDELVTRREDIERIDTSPHDRVGRMIPAHRVDSERMSA